MSPVSSEIFLFFIRKVFLSLLHVGTRSIISWHYAMDAEEVCLSCGADRSHGPCFPPVVFCFLFVGPSHVTFDSTLLLLEPQWVCRGNDTQHSCYFSLRVLFYLQSFLFDWSVLSLSHYLPQTIVLHALTFLLLTTLLLSIILNIFSSAVSLLPSGTQSSEVAATVSLDWAPLSTIILKCSTSSESDFVTRPHWCYCNSQNKMPFVLTVTVQH